MRAAAKRPPTATTSEGGDTPGRRHAHPGARGFGSNERSLASVFDVQMGALDEKRRRLQRARGGTSRPCQGSRRAQPGMTRGAKPESFGEGDTPVRTVGPDLSLTSAAPNHAHTRSIDSVTLVLDGVSVPVLRTRSAGGRVRYFRAVRETAAPAQATVRTEHRLHRSAVARRSQALDVSASRREARERFTQPEAAVSRPSGDLN